MSLLKINSLSSFFFWGSENGKFIVFNKASGQTHIVNKLCFDTLKLLQEAVLEPISLVEMLAERNGFIYDEQWNDYINGMLIDLDRLGLIEPVL